MILSLSPSELVCYLSNQVYHFFPDGRTINYELMPFIQLTLDRVDYCFSRINVKHYYTNGHTQFNHLHSGQYSIFLYYLSNTIWRCNGDISIATKIYYLNKLLHSIDIYFEVELPDIFLLEHPLGTVLGRAKYRNYFVAFQQCTVGGNLDFDYPTLEEGVVLFAGSKVIGRSHLKNNCWISADTLLIDDVVPENHLAFGKSPAIVTKATSKNVIERFFSRGNKPELGAK